jgi:hypothetical protein
MVKIRPTDHDLTSSEGFLNRTSGSGRACCVKFQDLEMPPADHRQPVRRSWGWCRVSRIRPAWPGRDRLTAVPLGPTTGSGYCMREYASSASRRRDERLSRIRKLSLWITGGAAAASLGMGTAFAHAIPGHSTTTRGNVPATGTTGGSSAGAGSSGAGGSAAGNGGTTTRQGSARKTGGHHRHRLAPPASAPAAAPSSPAPAPPPPVVSSGGS